jgi:hypothetical protein
MSTLIRAGLVRLGVVKIVEHALVVVDTWDGDGWLLCEAITSTQVFFGNIVSAHSKPDIMYICWMYDTVDIYYVRIRETSCISTVLG